MGLVFSTFNHMSHQSEIYLRSNERSIATLDLPLGESILATIVETLVDAIKESLIL